MRRKLAKPYAMSSLVSYEPYVNECTALLKSRLGEIAAAGKDANMGRWFQLYAFDVIGQITVCIAGDGLLVPRSLDAPQSSLFGVQY
jgi:hypothetical protein